MRTFLIRISILIALIILGWYLYFETRTFTRGPEIIFFEPSENSVVVDPLTTVVGRAPNASHITLNGREIFIDTEGNFEETLLLTPGYTIIEVAVRDRFDRTATSTLTLVHIPSPPPQPGVAPQQATSSSLATSTEE